MLFAMPSAQVGLVLIGTGMDAGPSDGTTYMGTLLNNTVVLNSLSGVPFGLTSFDLAGYYGLLTPPTLQAIGFRQDGTTVTNNFTNPGNSFQTLQLGQNSWRSFGRRRRPAERRLAAKGWFWRPK